MFIVAKTDEQGILFFYFIDINHWWVRAAQRTILTTLSKTDTVSDPRLKPVGLRLAVFPLRLDRR